MIITLSWPNRLLSPNDRSHWAKKAPLKAAYRQEGYLKAKQHALLSPLERHHVTLIFYPPSNRHYDIDNLLACLKSGLDGIADGLGINDKLFRPITIDFGYADKNNSRVEVTINEI